MPAIISIRPSKLEPYINPENARTLACEFGASLVIAKGTLIGMVTATGKCKAYTSGAVDGSQIPIGVLEYDIVTDASGLVTYGGSGSTPDWLRGGSSRTAPVYWCGAFAAADLVGLDATAITNGKFRDIGVAPERFILLPS